MTIGANQYSQVGCMLKPPEIKTLRELTFAQSTTINYSLKIYDYEKEVLCNRRGVNKRKPQPR